MGSHVIEFGFSLKQEMVLVPKSYLSSIFVRKRLIMGSAIIFLFCLNNLFMDLMKGFESSDDYRDGTTMDGQSREAHPNFLSLTCQSSSRTILLLTPLMIMTVHLCAAKREFFFF